MKKLAIIIGLFAASLTAANAQNVIHVDSYYKSNGTYVNSYYRTTPDYTISNNFSTYPNVNPYTGKTGTIKQW